MNKAPEQKIKKTKTYRCDSECILYIKDQYERCEFTEDDEYNIDTSPVRYLCPLFNKEPKWKLVKGGEISER